jgi:hypothetical protein
LYQGNKSAILLETNGKKSSGKRTRALNIRYFFLTDQVEKGKVTIVYCPTDDMEIFIPSPYKARSSGNSETQFSDAIVNRNGIQRYKTRNANTTSNNKKKRTPKKIHVNYMQKWLSLKTR